MTTENTTVRSAYCCAYRQKNKEKAQAASKLHYQANRDRLKEQAKNNYLKRRDTYLARSKEKRKDPEWRANQIAYIKEYEKEYVKRPEVKERIKERSKINRKKKLVNSIEYRIAVRLRDRLGKALKRKNHTANKHFKTMELIGCNIGQLMEHLESQFLPGMSWDNNTRNGWHIDHIKPINIFDLRDPVQQRICFHYTNLRPLWASDNCSRPKDGSDLIRTN
jgi:hypothetical protein